MERKGFLNSEEVDKVLHNVFTYLDKIDLKPYLNKCNNKPIQNLMDKLEKDFLYKDEYVESLFDAVAEDEFIDYLQKRYNNIYTRETTITYLYVRNKE